MAEAFLGGIEERVDEGQAVEHVASVASFFVSRIDSMVDPLLETRIARNGNEADLAKELRGQVAVASAKRAYQIYKEISGSDRFNKLAAHGARVQRLLWASTGAKNPDYSDVDEVTQQLEDEGVEKFSEPFDKLMAVLAQRSRGSEGPQQ